MDVVDAVLNQYKSYIDQSPKAPNSYNESDTIFPRFDKNTILKICEETTTKIEKVGSLVTITPPVVYVGDIHGNLSDLLRILHIFGMPTSTQYLFLGDYVDRGSHSIEVITILMALFCKYPDKVVLLRGNHEFSAVNKIYGFYEETLNSYGTEEVWSACNNVFGYMPFAAISGNQIFCVHGGLSTELTSTNTIKEIDLPVGLYDETELISDLVWSDPVDEINLFEQNKRGCGVLYGPGAITNFLKNTKLKVILRAHQCVPTGYSFNCNNMCITLFSSSDYCKQLQNKCGVIYHNENKELLCYCLRPDSDVGVKPKAVMQIAAGQLLGLKPSKNKPTQLPNTASQTGKKKPISIPKVPLTPTKSSSGHFCNSSRVEEQQHLCTIARARVNTSNSAAKRKGSESIVAFEKNKLGRRSTLIGGTKPVIDTKTSTAAKEAPQQATKLSKSLSSEQLNLDCQTNQKKPDKQVNQTPQANQTPLASKKNRQLAPSQTISMRRRTNTISSKI